MSIFTFSANRQNTDETEFLYADSYISTALAGLRMHIFAAIFVGVTWNRFPNQLVKQYINSNYKSMEALPAANLFAICSVVPFYRRNGEAIPREYRNPQGQIVRSSGSSWGHRTGSAFLACVFIRLTYTMQWDYFVTFLDLPGSLCVSLL